ncbi:MAG TPA: DUF4350 domain-containing protein [Candidatus Didemnitutus sp.]|nr:DUF4350 domain-containing protein [Candidatus Didemnitutus sp.]
MRRVKAWLLLTGVLVALLAGIVAIYDLRLASGDVYPAYSSLRADAFGTRGLHDALASLPGLTVTRDFRPLAQLEAGPKLVLIAGADWTDWTSQPAELVSALNRVAQSGGRIVVAFVPNELRDQGIDPPDPATKPDEKADEKKDAEPGTTKPSAKKEHAKKPDQTKDAKDETKSPNKKNAHKTRHPELLPVKLQEKWGVEIKQRWLFSAEQAELVDHDAVLPGSIPWHSDVFFQPAKDSPWTVLYRRANEPVVIERKFGAGSIVLMADCFTLSNESLQRNRVTGLLVWLLGTQKQIVFAESTLGVVENNGVGALARRYGLGGAVTLCALLGALYAWRMLAPFVPRSRDEETESIEVSQTPTAGFTALLRRSLDPAALLATCMEEWKRARLGSGDSAATRLDAVWRVRPADQPPSETYNAVTEALRRR